MSFLPEVASLTGSEGDDSPNSFESLCAMELPPKNLVWPWKWNVLIAPLSPAKKTKGGILLADDTADAQDYLVAVGLLIDIGPQAMTGKRLCGEKLDGWCPKVGQWVMFSRYAGWRIFHSPTKRKLVVCNDDDIVGPVHDPRDWKVLV